MDSSTTGGKRHRPNGNANVTPDDSNIEGALHVVLSYSIVREHARKAMIINYCLHESVGIRTRNTMIDVFVLVVFDTLLKAAARVNFSKFDDSHARLPSHLPRIGISAMKLIDIDGDMDLDVVVGRSLARNQVWINDGHGAFHEIRLLK